MKPPALIPIAFLALATFTQAADPAWWTTRGVKTGSAAGNLAPATVGQAKHMAAMALAELETRIPAPAFTALEADVNAVADLSVPNPLPADWDERHRAPLLTGQLKALAKPFYDQLRALDSNWMDHQMLLLELAQIEPGTFPLETSPYPWSESTADDANKATATIGQLKAVFSLDFSLWGSTVTDDTDGDGIPDDLENITGTSPTLTDSDGDGVPDNLDAFPLDATRSAFGNPDPSDQTPPLVSLSAPANAIQTSGP